jgi:hypothetical protein
LTGEVTVTGVVREFSYDAYTEDHDLRNADSYTGFDAEEFLVATGGPSASDPGLARVADRVPSTFA